MVIFLASKSHRLTNAHELGRLEDGELRGFPSGCDCTLTGEAIWDQSRSAFTAFDLLGTGPRWGAAQYNNRADDLGPAPMGIALTLGGNEPRDRTPPHQIHHRDYFRVG